MKTLARFLPSIASLRALEALDRLGSASAVAKELSQTQSAVSRQLQALEAQLGVNLILRKAKRMQMTPEARLYTAQIRQALQTISRASLDLTLTPQGGTLNLAILPTFGMRWLVPRLADFTRRYPDITLNMATRLQPFDFGAEENRTACGGLCAGCTERSRCKPGGRSVCPALTAYRHQTHGLERLVYSPEYSRCCGRRHGLRSVFYYYSGGVTRAWCGFIAKIPG